MRIGMVGAGLQAKRRLASFTDHPEDTIAAIASSDLGEARALADAHRTAAVGTWRELVADESIDAMVVCSTPDSHFEIASAAIEAGKHTLVEKPLTRTSAQARELADLADRNGVVFACGFNHRYHPAVSRALQLVAEGTLGRPLSMRGLYGIGGRSGIEREWRSDPDRAAGGQLMEQGIHLVDLVLAVHPGVSEVFGHVDTVLFPIEPLEDMGTAVLVGDRFSASVSSSLLQWRNTFSLEVTCQDGYVTVDGLGGSYGNEVLTVGRRDEHAPFAEEKTYFRGADRSWSAEWTAFAASVSGTGPRLDPYAAAKAMRIVEAAYESSATGRRVQV